MYGSQPSAFGNGRIALQQGGSAGGTVPHRTLVYGLAPPSPTIDTTVLPMARPGQAYTSTLSASAGTAPYTWALASGTLPSGITLSSSGTIAGTTSATGTFSVTVRVTDSKGATRTGAIVLGVITTGTASWNAALRGPDNNAFEPAETTIGLGSAPSLGYRYTLAQPSVTSVGANKDQPLVVGNRAYLIGPDGLLRAWDTTGTTTNRPALWAKGSDPADPARTFGGNPPSLSYSNGTAARVRGTRRLAHGSGPGRPGGRPNRRRPG
ncbi:MAG: Ig domain-containing protein [Dermatophilaceae bacterium]